MVSLSSVLLVFWSLTLVAARDLFHVADNTANANANAIASTDSEVVEAAAPVVEESPRRRQLRARKGNALRGSNAAARRKTQQKNAAAAASAAAASAVTNQQQLQQQQKGFDFVIAGFPKCGTTTLLKAFAAHEETDMAQSEQCAIASPAQADARVHKLLDNTLSTLSTESHIQRSFKCPTAMYNYKSIARMESHSPNAKFVVGMRHPVKMMQSFYNYRVTEIKEKGLDEPIPSLEQVLAGNMPWKGVSMQATRFELFLMQMGKTKMTFDQLEEFVGHNYDLAVKPTNFQVFLYTTDQLEDTDPRRSAAFRRDMQTYLGLQTPIASFGHENKNHAVGKDAHEESIDICDSQWSAVRAQLVQQGAQTAAWLREHFVHSDDVTVANREHFLQSLESWGVDPCAVSTTALA